MSLCDICMCACMRAHLHLRVHTFVNCIAQCTYAYRIYTYTQTSSRRDQSVAGFRLKHLFVTHFFQMPTIASTDIVLTANNAAVFPVIALLLLTQKTIYKKNQNFDWERKDGKIWTEGKKTQYCLFFFDRFFMIIVI